jgi:hypothetical protein
MNVPPVAPTAPAGLAPPVIAGKAQQGQVLIASTGSWAGDPTFFTYQWERCTASCTDIAGALGASYTAVAADVGATLRVVVTAYNTGGPASQASASTTTIAPLGPENTSPPVLSGSAAPGFSLTTSLGTWTGPGLTYSIAWRRCDTSGAQCVATGVSGTATYDVSVADTGSRLRAFVTATNSGGSTTVASAPSSVVPPPAPAHMTPPDLTGDAKVGSTLTSSTGIWTGASSYAYHWWRCVGTTCAYVADATGATYRIGSDDIGATFRAVVTATGPGGSAAAHSDATNPVAATVTQKVALLSGKPALSLKPVGGGIFRARIAVARTDGRAVKAVKVGCGAEVKGRLLHVRGRSFVKGVATCTWVLPRWTSGKKIAGTVRVTAAGLRVARSFAAKIG